MAAEGWQKGGHGRPREKRNTADRNVRWKTDRTSETKGAVAESFKLRRQSGRRRTRLTRRVLRHFARRITFPDASGSVGRGKLDSETASNATGALARGPLESGDFNPRLFQCRDIICGIVAIADLTDRLREAFRRL